MTLKHLSRRLASSFRWSRWLITIHPAFLHVCMCVSMRVGSTSWDKRPCSMFRDTCTREFVPPVGKHENVKNDSSCLSGRNVGNWSYSLSYYRSLLALFTCRVSVDFSASLFHTSMISHAISLFFLSVRKEVQIFEKLFPCVITNSMYIWRLRSLKLEVQIFEKLLFCVITKLK